MTTVLLWLTKCLNKVVGCQCFQKACCLINYFPSSDRRSAVALRISSLNICILLTTPCNVQNQPGVGLLREVFEKTLNWELLLRIWGMLLALLKILSSWKVGLLEDIQINQSFQTNNLEKNHLDSTSLCHKWFARKTVPLYWYAWYNQK